jgi:hypothetical protein
MFGHGCSPSAPTTLSRNFSWIGASPPSYSTHGLVSCVAMISRWSTSTGTRTWLLMPLSCRDEDAVAMITYGFSRPDFDLFHEF